MAKFGKKPAFQHSSARAERVASAPGDAGEIRRKLAVWFSRHQRRLPWRATEGRWPDPYHVLVAETMLQQTQVATVIDYFQRFIAAFPTLEALAEAQERQVLRLWQGLGYYRRARHLHAAARRCVQAHQGQVPMRVAELRELPGVGRYTAGAVASMAHGISTPIVDANAARVLARLFAVEQPIDKGPAQRRLWEYAQQLVPERRPDRFNQALMELGSLICTPTQPHCGGCPVRNHCRARKSGQVEALPVISPKRAKRQVDHSIIAVDRRGRFLFEQRPANGLWSNMWQLPTVEHDESTKDCDLYRFIQENFGLRTVDVRLLGQFTHQTTHRDIGFSLYHAAVDGGRLKPHTGLWRRLDRVDDLPLANPQRRALRTLAETSEPTSMPGALD